MPKTLINSIAPTFIRYRHETQDIKAQENYDVKSVNNLIREAFGLHKVIESTVRSGLRPKARDQILGLFEPKGRKDKNTMKAKYRWRK